MSSQARQKPIPSPRIAAAVPTWWHRASDLALGNGASLTGWTDRTGNGYNYGIGAVAPTFQLGAIGGMPAVRFGTTANNLVTSKTLTGTCTGFSWAGVIYINAFTQTFEESILFAGDQTTGFELSYDAVNGVSDTQWRFGYDPGNTNTAKAAKTRYSSSRPVVLCYVYDGAAGTAKMFLDGQCVFLVTGVAASLSITGVLHMGSWQDGGIDLDFGDDVGWLRALSDSEVKGVMADLRDAYNLAIPSVKVTGDSIQEGNGLTPVGVNIACQIEAELPEVVVVGAARGGSTGADWTGTALPFSDPGEARVVIIGPPSIDVGNGVDEPTCTGYITTQVTAAHLLGRKAIVLPMVPRLNSANPVTQAATEAVRVAMNASIMSGTTGADIVPNICLLAPFSTSTSYLDGTYYQADGIHLTAAAYAAMKPFLVRAVRQALFGYDLEVPTIVNSAPSLALKLASPVNVTNTTYTAVTGMSLTLEAGTWIVEWVGAWNDADNTAGHKIRLDFGGVSCNRITNGIAGNSGFTNVSAIAAFFPWADTDVVSEEVNEASGFQFAGFQMRTQLICPSTVTVTLQIAQNTNDGTHPANLRYAYMSFQRVQ